ncbi:MAG TPA: DHH family phosphoesterase [Thermoplasmata archaeon]|nr:DHH family phosphoesterase [Thermoplasmata archaeon]
MPSGPESFVDHPRYGTEFTKAREVLLAHPGRWRVIYHYDGDGIASASSAVRALRRLGYPVQATAFQGVERGHMEELLRATRGPVWVVDTGATWLDLFATHPHPVLILDHHLYPDREAPDKLPPRVAFVNPLDWGVDGMGEMCAATLTWLYTIFLDPRNWDNAPWGISGAIADRQHVGGFRGLNARLMEEATQRNFLRRGRRLALGGATIAEALSRSIDPFFKGISGHLPTAQQFVTALGVDPARAPGALSAGEAERLHEALEAHLKEQGVRPEFVAAYAEDGWQVPSLGLDAEELSNLQSATGRLGTPGLGIALAMGDGHALTAARKAEEEWRGGILNGMRRLEDGGVERLPAVQWFESPDGPLAGTQAGLAMNYLLDPNHPVLVGSRTPDGVTHVSARGTPWLVSRGLDLATALREAGALVGGEGGGHAVAAGATVPAGKWKEFLAAVDERVSRQLPASGVSS